MLEFAKDPKFWEKVRTSEEFKWHREEILELYEKAFQTEPRSHSADEILNNDDKGLWRLQFDHLQSSALLSLIYPENEEYYYGEGHLQMCRFVQIELKSAAEDAARIAAIPYLDGCILGMHDLSGSISRLGDVFCEENLSLAQKAISAFKKAGKTVGVSTFATDEETLKRYDSMGINMISTGADYDYILKKSKETLGTINKIQNGR